MFIIYSGQGDKYASAGISKRSGNSVSKTYVYLGLVVDREKGIYRNKERGTFTFNPETGEFGSVPDTFREPRIEDKRVRRNVSLDFGDAFLLHSYIQSSGFCKVLDSLEYGNRDTLNAMVLFYILSTMANCDAKAWYNGSIASCLYPGANLSGQRASDFLASIGTADKEMAYQKAYIDFVMSNFSEDKNILVDSSGLPNKVHMPLTAINVHNGKVSNEVRLIFVVQKSTGLPLFFMTVPGNVVDVSTLKRVMLYLKELGIDIESCIIDAGYNSAENLDYFYDAGHACRIGFISRVKSNDSNLRDMVRRELPTLESKENFVKFEDRYLFVKKEEVKVGTKKSNPAFLYLGLDCERLNDEQHKLFKKAKKQKLSTDEVFEAMDGEGVFAIISGTDYSADEILPAYYQRQAAEQIFDFAKNYTKLLPLRTHSEKTFRGHLLLSYIATCLVKMMHLKLRTEDMIMGSSLQFMRNQKCRVFPSRIITDTPAKDANDIYSALKISCPESIPIADGRLVYSPPVPKEKKKKEKAPKVKGKPGRPRKNPLPDPNAAPKKGGRSGKVPEVVPAAPRKRGRPKKNLE
jgi:hypothetical protein